MENINKPKTISARDPSEVVINEITIFYKDYSISNKMGIVFNIPKIAHMCNWVCPQPQKKCFKNENKNKCFTASKPSDFDGLIVLQLHWNKTGDCGFSYFMGSWVKNSKFIDDKDILKIKNLKNRGHDFEDYPQKSPEKRN